MKRTATRRVAGGTRGSTGRERRVDTSLGGQGWDEERDGSEQRERRISFVSSAARRGSTRARVGDIVLRRASFTKRVVFYARRFASTSATTREALVLLIGRGDVRLRSEAEISSRGRHFAPRRRRRRRASARRAASPVIIVDPLVSLSIRFSRPEASGSLSEFLTRERALDVLLHALLQGIAGGVPAEHLSVSADEELGVVPGDLAVEGWLLEEGIHGRDGADDVASFTRGAVRMASGSSLNSS